MSNNLNLFQMEGDMIRKAVSKYPTESNEFLAKKLCISERDLYRKFNIHQIERPKKARYMTKDKSFYFKLVENNSIDNQQVTKK